MKSYRAVVIDGRRALKCGVQIVVVALLLTICVVNAYKISKDGPNPSKRDAQRIIDESIPVFSAVTDASDSDGEMPAKRMSLQRLFSWFVTFDPSDYTTVLAAEIPLMDVAGDGYLAMKARGEAVEVYNPENADKGEGEAEPAVPQGEQYPIKAIDSSQAKSLSGGNAKVFIRNETNYSIDIEEMLESKLGFDMKGEGPKVLIVHTHATECYAEEGATMYSADKSDRCLEEDKNVIAVGAKIKQVFEANGIETIHDKTLHDHPNFNGSYANSLKTVEGYKAKYPSIRVVFDIHRDAYVYDDGAKAKFVTEVDGKPAAQLMMVVGTDAGGLEHSGWRENMKLALKLQKHISTSYPSLMRGVNLRKERFNGHTTTGSMIIEVGSSGNTLAEALNGAEYGATKIAEFLKELK